VVSDEFQPMVLPTAMLYPVRIPSGKTKSFTVGPLIVEDNFRGVEQSDAGVKNGFIPPWLVIDGQHRWLDAINAGQKTMHCLVGVNAVPKIHAELLKWAAAGKFEDKPPRKYGKAPEETGPRKTLEYIDPAPEECLTAGTVCEHCRHFVSRGTTCGLFQLLDVSAAVKPDAYCNAFV
jgi:hypothetical protein